MTARTRRPSNAYLLGIEAPAVEVPAWAADWLVRMTNLDEQRIALRGVDPLVDDVLVAIRTVAMAWRGRGSAAGSGAGTALTVSPEPAPQLRLPSGKHLAAGDAAQLIGITDTAVRKACREGRLKAELVGGRWLIPRAEVERYRFERAA